MVHSLPRKVADGREAAGELANPAPTTISKVWSRTDNATVCSFPGAEIIAACVELFQLSWNVGGVVENAPGPTQLKFSQCANGIGNDPNRPGGLLT